MAEVTITVRGMHERALDPEEALAHVTATAEGTSREEVMAQVGALTATLREEVETLEHSGVVSHRSAARLSVWTERPWSPDGHRLAPVHHASAGMTATFTDVAELSRWLSTIAERGGIRIDSVQWRLSPATRTQVEREVAALAVAVAVERASAYAAAIGRPTLTPVEIADIGLLDGGGSGVEPPALLRAAMAGDAASGPGIVLSPDDIVVRAAVDVRFVAS